MIIVTSLYVAFGSAGYLVSFTIIPFSHLVLSENAFHHRYGIMGLILMLKFSHHEHAKSKRQANYG